MLPTFLVPEIEIRGNGASEPVALDTREPLLITLGVLKVIEQESLLVSIEGSSDGAQWQPAPLVSFPEKFYPGVSAVYLDTAEENVRFVRAAWKVNRWGRGDKTPLFRIYVFVEAVGRAEF